MGHVLIALSDKVEKELREAIRNKYRGKEKGMISYTVEEAIIRWLELEKERKNN